MEKTRATSIKNWPADDRPREKLLRRGASALSNSELLAILLRTGTSGASAIDLARKILKKFGTFRNMAHTDIREWSDFKGLGGAKIAQIQAALEISRRYYSEEKRLGTKIANSRDIVDLFSPHMRDLKVEVFKIALLDNRNRLVDIVETAHGSVRHAHPIIREIISQALQKFASGMVCVHNHPSGDCAPSKEDRDFTGELVRACKTMQITMIDHIIIGDSDFYSFADSGELRPYV